MQYQFHFLLDLVPEGGLNSDFAQALLAWRHLLFLKHLQLWSILHLLQQGPGLLLDRLKEIAVLFKSLKITLATTLRMPLYRNPRQ